MYENLTARGYRVAIVQNPLTSLEDDVAATTRVLDRQDGQAILVGHSWGGTVITEAGNHPAVAGLVYVSALAPDSGENTSKQYEGFAPTPSSSSTSPLTASDSSTTTSSRSASRPMRATPTRRFSVTRRCPSAWRPSPRQWTHAAWRDKPAWAIIATEDNAFDQAMLEHMATRASADITYVPASHALFLTQADAVSEVIHSAALNATRMAATAEVDDLVEAVG